MTMLLKNMRMRLWHGERNPDIPPLQYLGTSRWW
jgi:hypothetical protein